MAPALVDSRVLMPGDVLRQPTAAEQLLIEKHVQQIVSIFRAAPCGRHRVPGVGEVVFNPLFPAEQPAPPTPDRLRRPAK